MTQRINTQRNNLFHPVQEQFDKFFDSFFSDSPLNSIKANSSFPKINIFEKDDLVIMASVSGMKPEDINIEVEGNVLIISGRMSYEYHAPSDSLIHIRELRSTSFERKITLPDNIVGDPEALLKDGILTLKWKLKKTNQESNLSKKIKIRAE